jgi:hypothetical protein
MPSGVSPIEDWLEDDLEWGDPSLDMELGLPLRGENFVNGEPQITVDYFECTASDSEVIVDCLLALDGAVLDEGAQRPRVLVFDTASAGDHCDPMALIAIASLTGNVLRLETAQRALSDRMRDSVQIALGAGARFRERRFENPVAVYLEE